MFPVDSVIAISPPVPFIVTEDLIPEPVPPAVKLRTAELAPPAATGNVYVSFVFDGAVYVTLLFVESKATLAPPEAANCKSTVSVTVNCSVPPELAIPNEVVFAVPAIVTAPVAALTDMLLPATILVTPVLLIVSVDLTPAVAIDVDIPVVPTMSTSSPSSISLSLPVVAPSVHDVYDPDGVAHTLSPLKNLVALGVPVAERSEVVVITPEVWF